MYMEALFIIIYFHYTVLYHNKSRRMPFGNVFWPFSLLSGTFLFCEVLLESRVEECRNNMETLGSSSLHAHKTRR